MRLVGSFILFVCSDFVLFSNRNQVSCLGRSKKVRVQVCSEAIFLRKMLERPHMACLGNICDVFVTLGNLPQVICRSGCKITLSVD